MDHELIRRLHQETGARAQAWTNAERLSGVAPSEQAYRVRAAAFANDVVSEHIRSLLAAGQQAPTPADEASIVDAILARMFGAGRLQQMLEDPALADMTDLDINGSDEVWATFTDGRQQRLPAVAESDDELVELVQTLASYVGRNPRPWDAASPQLNLRLSDGSRLAATYPVLSGRPAVSVRRSLHPRVFLDQLVEFGSVSPELAAFLRAAVRTRHNIVIAGATRAGKTTLLRALCNEIPPTERLIICEDSLEIGLRAHPDLHENVVEMESRLPNSEGAGQVTLAQLVRHTLRMNPDRVIVGEVRGPEALVMLSAMTQGNDGSMSTIHARHARQVFERLATLAASAGEGMDLETSRVLISQAIDFVVYCDQVRVGRDTTQRVVSTVLEVTGYDGVVQASEVFRLAGMQAGYTGIAVSRQASLAEAGWNPSGYGAALADTVYLDPAPDGYSRPMPAGWPR
jgi:Flp pilus assembly CpaF family ATPase